MKKSRTVIAIDGPSASGKSTVSKAVAEALQYNYVDTGAMYRAVAWKCLEEGIDASKSEEVIGLMDRIQLHVEIKGGRSRVFVDGVCPERAIRSEQVSGCVSLVAAIPEVRKKMVDVQRRLADEGDLVIEGRDIGTVVFPTTPHKFFLDAVSTERVRRRAVELDASAERIAETIKKRDERDSMRTASPLKPADDAIRIDTSNHSISAVVDLILKHVRTRHFSK